MPGPETESCETFQRFFLAAAFLTGAFFAFLAGAFFAALAILFLHCFEFCPNQLGYKNMRINNEVVD